MNDLMVVEKLANWEKLKALVLDSVSSPITKRPGIAERGMGLTTEPKLPRRPRSPCPISWLTRFGFCRIHLEYLPRYGTTGQRLWQTARCLSCRSSHKPARRAEARRRLKPAPRCPQKRNSNASRNSRGFVMFVTVPPMPQLACATLPHADLGSSGAASPPSAVDSVTAALLFRMLNT